MVSAAAVAAGAGPAVAGVAGAGAWPSFSLRLYSAFSLLLISVWSRVSCLAACVKGTCPLRVPPFPPIGSSLRVFGGKTKYLC